MPHTFETKTIELQGEFISCLTCSVNYDSKGEPKYCQYLKQEIKPRAILENHKRAVQCNQYCPFEVPRWARIVKEK